jgi:thioredoxin reductase (NADPH)
MAQPVLLAVTDDGEVLARLRQALEARYGAEYRVLADRSATGALKLLERLHEQGEPVALVIADQWMPQLTGVELLARARELHPKARRLLLMGVMDRRASKALSQAMALGRLDGWLLKPWDPAEEYLYLPVGEQLIEWARTTGAPGFVVWRIVGQQRSPRSHELRDLLDRNAILYQFHPHDSEAGRELLRESGQDGSRLPVLVLFDGRALVDPSNAEVAAAIGVAIRPEPGRYDPIVVGAGRAVADQGQPGGGGGPAPAAELDGRGWQHPIRG